MRNEPQFRMAGESDAGTLLRFMREYYARNGHGLDGHGLDGHGFDEPKAHVALIALLRDSNLGRVWLILDGAGAVGYVVLCLGYSLEWLGREAFVDEFYMLQEYRQRGWARKTMEFVEEAARSAGVRTLHLEVVRQNTATVEVYRNLGFMEHGSTFVSKWIAHDFSKPQGHNGH